MKCPKCLKIFHLEQMTQTSKRKRYCFNCAPLIIKQQNYWKDYYRNQPGYQERKKQREWLKTLDRKTGLARYWIIKKKYQNKKEVKNS